MLASNSAFPLETGSASSCRVESSETLLTEDDESSETLDSEVAISSP
jgi:hypothetical protein